MANHDSPFSPPLLQRLFHQSFKTVFWESYTLHRGHSPSIDSSTLQCIGIVKRYTPSFIYSPSFFHNDDDEQSCCCLFCGASDRVGPQEENREGGKEEDVLRLHYRRCDGGYDQSAVLSKL